MSRPTPTGGETARTIPDARSGAAARVRRRLSGGAASLIALVVAVVWTLPTAGLFVSSFRPAEQIRTTGWWTFFSDPTVTLDNYRDVLFGGAGD
ncbi:MAG TPA: carbohydrate ABC transporter permease, partial [Nocardiopsis listeri]|nr:carbohydrate ABC transporter permease [Nocardiopsis listeri]